MDAILRIAIGQCHPHCIDPQPSINARSVEGKYEGEATHDSKELLETERVGRMEEQGTAHPKP